MAINCVFCLFVALSLAISLHAQFGVSGHHFWNDAEAFDLAFTDVNGDPVSAVPDQGWQAGVDYWFRLKNTRIEFLPTLSFGRISGRADSGNDFIAQKIQIASFFFNTNFYLFDMAGDCDCPTFSKEGNTLQKGLFFQVSPGVSYFRYGIETVEGEQTSSEIAFGAGAGAGFDLGVSDFLTLTPFAGLRYYPRVDGWAGDIPNVGDTGSSLLQTLLGIRVGLRLDD
jgi:hypothetical protein